MFHDRHQRKPSWLAFAGAVLAALAVALSAYAAHGKLDPHAQSNLQTAAMYAFGHGLALAALSYGTTRQLGLAGMVLMLLGTLAFSGSLALSVFAGTPTRLAPFGGVSLMLGWLLWGVDALRS